MVAGGLQGGEGEVKGVLGLMEGESKEMGRGAEEAAVLPTKGAEEDEEEQMVKFSALLRNVREMREQWRRRAVSADRPTKRPRVEGPSWTPTFQWEDFAGVAGLVRGPAPAISGTSEAGEQGGTERKEEGTGLELKLALWMEPSQGA